MKRISYFISITVLSLALTSCGCFDKFESRGFIPADAYGNDVKLTETSLAQMSWREFFTDPLLQQLIDSVLARNTDINSVRIAVEKSEASLKAAKLAYLPSLYFSPQGTLSSFDYGPVSKTYNLPLQLSLDIDAFGSITNQKRKSQAVLMQAKISEESLRANLVSTVAQQYFMLQLLDRQLQILTATDSLWNASLETEKILWENGKIYSTAVNQMESSYLNVKTQIVDTRRNIRSVENAICRLLAQTPQHINRSAWGSSLHHPEAKGDTGQRMFDTQFLLTGVPAMLLKNRCKNVISGIFGDDWKVVDLPSTGVLNNVDELYKRQGEVGFSTNGFKVIQYLNEKNIVVDKIMMFTDCQMWNSQGTKLSIRGEWRKYKKFAPNAKLYLFDLAGYRAAPLDIVQDDVALIAGWSDRIFEILNAIENGSSALKEIEKVEI